MPENASVPFTPDFSTEKYVDEAHSFRLVHIILLCSSLSSQAVFHLGCALARRMDIMKGKLEPYHYNFVKFKICHWFLNDI